MLFNIIIFFIILIILCLILNYSKSYKEGFFDFPDVDHNVFVRNSQAKFNELTNTINLTDPAVPITPDTSDAFKIALGGIDTLPSSTSYNLASKINYTSPDNLPNSFQQAQSCEAAGTSCDAFDDPNFAANCGMSFDKKGVGVSGKPHIGGMFISSEDKKRQLDAANVVLSTGGAPYDPYKVYQPTFGKAKPGTFALNKDQCLVVKEKIDCATKQTFNSPNCTQCYTSQNFARVGPETGRIPSTLYIFGNGNVTVSSANNMINLPTNKLDANNAMTVEVPANAEGTVFSVVVQPSGNNQIPYVAGFIQGQTPRGTFKLDLFNLVESDQVSKTKPKLNGSITVNGFRCLTMVPGTGQTYLNLACLMPFSFLSMYDGDALTCDNGPIITQAASATFLESDPCFGKANQPGNYKLECLQTRWVEMGGTPQGTGYPSNKTKADAIQRDANGNPLDIDTIVNNLAPKMTSALTGQDATGKNLSISNWNTVSMWANGTPINTPCDGPNSQSGPLSQECLQYLYLNQGINSHIGPTYTLAPSSMASMKGQKTPNTYCQPGTIIDPSTPEGLKFAQGLGGINAVKQTYDQINRIANDNSQTNNARKTAIKQCYGVDIDPIQLQQMPKVPPSPAGVFIALQGNMNAGNGGYNIVYADQNLGQSWMKWAPIPGANTTISVAPNGSIFGTNYQQNVYYLPKYNNFNNQPWQGVNAGARQIYTDGNLVCHVNQANKAYYATFLDAVAGSWQALPSVLTKILTYNTQFYCVGLDNHIYYLTSPNAQWIMTMTNGLFKDLAIDENGICLMIGMDGGLYYSDSGLFTASQSYSGLSGTPSNVKFVSISFSYGSILAADSNGNAWFCTNYKSGSWIQLPGSQIAFVSHRISPNTPASTATTDTCFGTCNTTLTATNNICKVVTQNDGNLVIYDSKNNVVWATGTQGKGTPPYTTVMQSDGNYVLYDSSGLGGAIWDTGITGGTPPFKLVMQTDCNLVKYDANNNAVWSSNTAGKGQ
jgi:hypothetical protein